MSKYKIEQPMPQLGEDVYKIINVPEEVVNQIRSDVIDKCIYVVKEFEFITNEGMKTVLINNLEQLKEKIE